MNNGGREEELLSLKFKRIEFHLLFFILQQPNRLISPDTLLKRRKGNSFEMATLLCSLLIGNKFSAYVVSGYATREVTLNDQRRVDCPFIPNDEKVLFSVIFLFLDQIFFK